MAADPSPVPDDPSPASLTGDPVVNEARKRFNRCAEWESTARVNFLNDLKFAEGDDINGYQWPNAIRRARDVDSKPCLTMNVTRQHNLQIMNDAKQNKSSVTVRATGNGATKESADIFGGIIRHIEYQSNAQDAYSTACEFQVKAGRGVWRIVTDYAGSDGLEAFNQEIFIRRVVDPLSVFMDPDCQEKDKSDARFALVFDTVPRDEFDEAYPKYKGLATLQPLGAVTADGDWIGKDHVRICEYFRIVQKEDRHYSFMVNGERKALRGSKMTPEMGAGVVDDPQTRWRTVYDNVVEWKLIAGEQIIDETVWAGKYIPLVVVTGEETTLEGRLDWKGHTRAMRDSQRMFNYNASSQVEFVALQGKTPWKAPAKAIEEFESYWNTANTVNHSVLPWNHVDDEGNLIPPPERQDPPNASPAYQAGMDTAFNQMMMTSGQWQNQMGMMGNERTGEAIKRRQQQSDTSVYHFQDNYASALRFTGKQLLDLIPRIYDTKRVVKILANDGTDMEIEIDPAARQAYLQEMGHQDEVVKRVFNPAVGKYDVLADVGPAYGTRREETVQAMTMLLTQAPGLTGIIGDLLLNAMDFPEAQDAAIRMKRMVPAQALGTGPTQAEQLLQQQVTSLQGVLAKTLEAHAKDRLKLTGKDQMRDIDAYKAETDRFKALADSLGIDQPGLQTVIHQLVEESLQTHLTPIVQANAGGVQDQGAGDDSSAPTGGQISPQSAAPTGAPVPGARKAPDGEWYILDPTRRGKYLRVAPLAQERASPRVISNA